MAIQWVKNVFKTLAIDINDDKLKYAKEIAADLIFNLKNANSGKFTHDQFGGVHVAVVTAVSQIAFNQAVDSLRAGGKVVAVGLPKDKIGLSIVKTVLDGIQVAGSLVGTW